MEKMKKFMKREKAEIETVTEKEKITTREMQEIIKRTLEKKLRGYFEIQDETFISYETIHGQFFAINVISGDDVMSAKHKLISQYRKALISEHQRIEAEELSDRLDELLDLTKTKK